MDITYSEIQRNTWEILITYLDSILESTSHRITEDKYAKASRNIDTYSVADSNIFIDGENNFLILAIGRK